MQHTEKYNFSLIDAGDAFSPDALNANARQLEDQLARVEDGAAAETARVENSLTAEVARLDAAAAAETARVNTALNAKAAQTALTAEETARKTEIARLDAAAAAEKTRVNGEITKLNTAIGAGGTTARIVTGSYTGTGVYGKSNPTKLDFAKTLGKAPKLLFITTTGEFYMICLVQKATLGNSNSTQFGGAPCFITWTSTGLSWYSSTNAESQLNANSKEYFYVAIA